MIVIDAYGREHQLTDAWDQDFEIAMKPARPGARLVLHPWGNMGSPRSRNAAFALTAKKTHQKTTVREALERIGVKPSLPCTIVLQRIAHRGVLDDDGVPDAMKYVRDEIARWMGLNSDRKPGLKFLYGQQKTSRKGYLAVRVTIIQHEERTP